MQDRRKEQRWPAYLGARIVSSCRQMTADCLIRNSSSQGLRLVIDRGQSLPDEFLLQIPKRQVELKVRKRWRRGDDIGVESVPPELTQPIDLELERCMRELATSNEALKRRLADLSEAAV